MKELIKWLLGWLFRKKPSEPITEEITQDWIDQLPEGWENLSWRKLVVFWFMLHPYRRYNSEEIHNSAIEELGKTWAKTHTEGLLSRMEDTGDVSVRFGQKDTTGRTVKYYQLPHFQDP